jgi:hypothetical protein
MNYGVTVLFRIVEHSSPSVSVSSFSSLVSARNSPVVSDMVRIYRRNLGGSNDTFVNFAVLQDFSLELGI